MEHPRLTEIKHKQPTKVADEHLGINGKIALVITKLVGSMWCAYLFALIALISLPDAIKGGTATTISWIAQTFLQLVLLSVIMVGQDVQSKASDKRAIDTYKDTEAILTELEELKDLISQPKTIQVQPRELTHP